MPSRQLHRAFAFLWLAILVGIGLFLHCKLPNAAVETNILALLPDGGDDALPPELAEEVAGRLNRQMLWLVSDSNNGDCLPAEWWISELQKIPEIALVEGPVDAAAQSRWAEFFFKFRAQILTAKTRSQLAQNPENWGQWVVAQLYSPFAGVTSRELQRDPALLARAHQFALQHDSTAPVTFAQNWLTAQDASGKKWRLVSGELKNSSFDIAHSHALVEKLSTLESELRRRWPDSAVLQRGALFYSDYAATQAKSELGWLGTLSAIGVVLLVGFFFRSPGPFLLTILATGTGMITGIAALLASFEKVHLLALVLSTSVIGIAVDYALHFLTERMMSPPAETGFDALRRIMKPLVFSFFTTLLSYLVFLAAPFPGFRQITVYAIFGLAGAFLTVVLWFPFLSKKTPRRISKKRNFSEFWTRIWRTHKLVRHGIPALAAVVGAAGFFALETNDDIGAFQSFPASFRENEAAVGALTGQGADMTWFVVRSDSAEGLLQKMERLSPLLGELKGAKKISGARLLTDSLPSLDTQRKNHQVVSAALPAICASLRNSEIDIPDAAAPEFHPLLPDEWLASPVSRGMRLAWFGQKDGKMTALVPVTGVTDDAALRQVASTLPDVHWLNRRAQLSGIFSTYRIHFGKLLMVSLILVLAVFMVRFGIFRGLRTTLPVLLAVFVPFGVLAATGQPLNLFSLLALVLVLGIGIDYTLFFANENARPATTMLAVSVDALTTLLGFGMLAFSHLPAIAGFGLVLSSGIFTAYLLAPLAQNGNPPIHT
ncbi:MAG: hypothetical protein LBG65_04815 [Puniceicoccales bacterium]|jgi:predicted exporter|nr:hypothetical protein [Puniceicoccales bacterium]